MTALTVHSLDTLICLLHIAANAPDLQDVEAYSQQFGSGKSFSGSEVSFKELVELLHKPGEKVEGSGNALSYAVKKAGAKLEPMRIPRRSLRDDDVHFAITHCGEPALPSMVVGCKVA